MRIFYFILFALVGVFNMLAAVFDWRWYVDYWVYRGVRTKSKERNRGRVRILLFLAGAALAAYGAIIIL